jgi:hypothetical protein
MSELKEKPSAEQKLHRDQVLLDLEAVLATNEGRRVILWMLDYCCSMDTEPHSPAHADTAHILGRQWAGRRLIAALNGIDAKIYPTLRLEEARLKWPARPEQEDETHDFEDD